MQNENFEARPHLDFGPDYMVGEVYFISDGERIKIGYSGSAKVRAQGIQSAIGKPVEILATRPGTRREERALHNKFAHLRLDGEWFRPGPDLLAFIRGEGEPEPEIDIDDPELDARLGLRQLVHDLAQREWPTTVRVYIESLYWALKAVDQYPNHADARGSLKLTASSLHTAIALWSAKPDPTAKLSRPKIPLIAS